MTFQTILNTLSGLDNKIDSKPNEELCKENMKEIDEVLTALVNSTTSCTLTGNIVKGFLYIIHIIF